MSGRRRRKTGFFAGPRKASKASRLRWPANRAYDQFSKFDWKAWDGKPESAARHLREALDHSGATFPIALLWRGGVWSTRSG